MKKYQQLLLLIISFISLSLLLVYRHEYNRLHYVLEVFNFFGQPCNVSKLEAVDHVRSFDWGPVPLWQEAEGVHLYSGFWTDNEAKVIALQTSQNKIPQDCRLWFETKKKPVIGKFRFYKIFEDVANEQNIYYYYCSLSNIDIAPYAVSFTIKVKKNSELKKILLKQSVKSTERNGSLICVSPSSFSKATFIEFISYHKLIGIDNFVFYSDDIPHRLSRILINLSNKLSIRVTFFPWNYPFRYDSVAKAAVKVDCKLRNFGHFSNIIILEINDFIVPAYSNFNQVIHDPDVQNSSLKVSLPVQKMCMTKNDRRKPIILQNFQVSSNTDNEIKYIYRNNNNNNIVDSKSVVKGSASIYKFIDCLHDAKRPYNDKALLRYAADLSRSTLMQLFLHDKI